MSERQLRCVICEKYFTPVPLFFHLIQHVKQKNFDCLLCTQKFSTCDKLSNHNVINHKISTPYVCEFCSEKSLNLYQLYFHMLQDHDNLAFEEEAKEFHPLLVISKDESSDDEFGTLPEISDDELETLPVEKIASEHAEIQMSSDVKLSSSSGIAGKSKMAKKQSAAAKQDKFKKKPAATANDISLKRRAIAKSARNKKGSIVAKPKIDPILAKYKKLSSKKNPVVGTSKKSPTVTKSKKGYLEAKTKNSAVAKLKKNSAVAKLKKNPAVPKPKPGSFQIKALRMEREISTKAFLKEENCKVNGEIVTLQTKILTVKSKLAIEAVLKEELSD